MLERSNFGKIIAVQRVKMDLTLADCASLLGVSPSYLTLVERGKKHLSYSRAVKLLSVLGDISPSEYWYAFYENRKSIRLFGVSPTKKTLILSLLASDIDDTTIASIQTAVDNLQ